MWNISFSAKAVPQSTFPKIVLFISSIAISLRRKFAVFKRYAAKPLTFTLPATVNVAVAVIPSCAIVNVPLCAPFS
jgi:hypothetical protein